MLSSACIQITHAQILVSSGNYSQNFDSLLNTGTANTWTDNSTLPGWYAARAAGGPAFLAYRAGTGSENTGAIYSFGTADTTERAFGSAASGGTATISYGIRFLNDTALVVTNLTVSYTGEQWRNGGNTSTQPLAFSYRIAADTSAGADATNGFIWTTVPALTFTSPIATATAGALNGNDPANQQQFNVLLEGVVVPPGEEFFFRWVDLNDAGNDHGLAVDNLTISYTTVAPNMDPPTIAVQPQSQTVTQGNNVNFTVTAAGMIPFTYQWYYDNAPILDATNQSLTLTFVDTDQAGAYFVAVTNAMGGIESDDAILTVELPTVTETNIAYLRTLQGNPNYVPTNTTTLYSVKGVVTTFVNMTGSADAQFYLQDDTAGLAVFVDDGSTIRPANGDYVEVIGPLGHFNGLFELNLVAANPSHSVNIISNGAALTEPIVLDLASLTNIPYIEGLVEGARVTVSNVFIQGAGGFFVSGNNYNMTDLNNKVLQLRIDTRVIEMINQPIPEFVTSITGVLGQFGQGPAYTNGYQLFPLQYTDLNVIPVPEDSIPLNISVSGSDASISWLSAAQGFSLQGTPGLTTPDWQTILDTPVITNSLNVITIPATNNQFFRLVR
jgi:hypothetical protein